MGRAELFIRYMLLALMLVISIGPFVWQLSTSFKGPLDDIYSFPPSFIPADFTVENYAAVTRTIPVIKYAWHSLLIASGSVVTNVFFATLAGYAFGVMKFRFKGFFLALILSTLLLPAEVTLTEYPRHWGPLTAWLGARGWTFRLSSWGPGMVWLGAT